MTPMWSSILYLAAISSLSFFVGRLLPTSWFDYKRYPYRSFSFENEGKFYTKLKINKWQNKLPDMSRVFPKLMPSKKMEGRSPERLSIMIQETCIAEFVHGMLCLCALYCLKLWRGLGGILLSGLYIVLGNVPYILIQRYNRPRLVRLLKRVEASRIEGGIPEYDENKVPCSTD